ncbi:NAD-glutamate dehydrogenase [Aestuariivirga sp. YIM B02566]|uniref:NAD-glutamate dehydrogenase n=1 Tax=Taklimakanibacter albus TaxID=2800327 RepID=A0ACC5R7H7_9HYPH|nr:NAD-glutamate dehydrogenase [Aestuariivirga sp. YIM B02566]MBK1868328.1 NAD-glutamate dehydrogenase [Aestuariivirga sp. YIM B02566]
MSPHDPLVALIRTTEGKVKGEREKLLARLLLEKAPPEDLQNHPADDLGQLVSGRMAFLADRKPGRTKIAVTNPEGPFGAVTLVDILNDDMPFLVDSTISLLTERGYDVRLALHPVLSVKRDGDGKLTALEAKPSSDAHTMRESFMHFHLARINADEAWALEEDLKAIFADVRVAVLDWRAMQQRLREAITSYQKNPPPLPIEELTESIAFLQWLLDNHFTFLGMREYKFEGGAKKGVLEPIAETGLGILRQPEMEVLRRGNEKVAISPQIREFLMQPAALVITKSDMRANVHRRSAMDYIGVKLFDAEGELSGELRAIGLFTSSAYTQNPNEIPLLRKKLQQVVQASGFSPSGHSGKALVAVLEGFPRDELFQIDADVLADMAAGILRLEERPRTRLFVRRDKFDRFVSAFVFIPRDRFDSDVRRKVGDMLAEAFDGRVASFAPSFGEGTLVRVHFIILRNLGKDPKPDLASLEQRIVEVVRNWDDRLESALVAKGADQATIARWRGAFLPGYRDSTDPASSLKDIEEIDALAENESIGVEFIRTEGDGPRELHSRLYHQGDAIALGRRLPILENLGLQAISETTHILSPGSSAGRTRAVIHDVLLQAPANATIDDPATLKALEEAFLAVWTGMAENDGFNALTLREGLGWRDVSLLRALGRYIRQSAASFSPDYMAQTLVKYSPIARQLVTLFYALFDPRSPDEKAADTAKEKIEKALVDVYNLDEDRIIRRYVNLVSAVLRTNFFQPAKADGEPPLINFKISSKLVEGIPEPKPFAEIFVYAPDVEAVHLRAGPIARGGIRWSDRPEDFRTEVLGLAKAQNVKNAVIVPVGAKGGFVPKRLKIGDSREAIQAEGVRAYKRFISSLLDITDNLKGDKVVAPIDVVRRDKDDPYLVVAADKGTATFSDTANGISASHGFWLDDAFASGGSAGYDHKKMGITARGAWEAVKRHFREIDVDIQTTPFSVIGVGDMSGDVFGNGMLLSREIRLLAAFDHRDIFIDPEPDTEKSFKERERMFALPRSSWQDYDKALISKGGGVFSRSLKAIPLSPEMKKLTGLAGDKATPQELMRALLLVSADLLWFGGIGTYVKASNETQADAGDRANDALRVDADELKVKVIGEGANLGVTQRGRIEFGLNSGRINTDAVDNSAGVNSSDIEVNIKIGLSRAEAQGRLKREARNELLADMTEDVAGLVLRNNYLQTLCLSLALEQGTTENSYAIQLMQRLEKSGELDRKLEALPTDTVVIERDLKGGGLTRPELAVLMAYAKISLFGEIVASDVPDDPYLSRELKRYFPKAMQERFADDIEHHKLRREIIATMLANSMINRGGPSFIAYVLGESSAGPADIAAAYAAARDSFDFLELNTMIDGLDAKVPGTLQNKLYAGLQRLLRWSTVWFLRHEKLDDGLQQLIERYRDGLAKVEAVLAKTVPAADLEQMKARQSELEKQGVPAKLAAKLASHRFLQRAPDIVKIAERTGAGIDAVAAVLFATASELGVERLIEEGNALRARDLLERQAINRLRAQVFENHRGIVTRIVESKTSWADWRAKNEARAAAVIENMDTILASKPFDIARYAVAQGTLADLAIR